jgi:chromosome segregation ATPase
MASERLNMAIKNFQHMNQMVERYTRLCRAYVQLSERFHQLDVEHMKLKGHMVPLIKVAQDYKTRLQTVEAEKSSLQSALQQQTEQYQQELQNLTKTYEEKLQSLTQDVEELKPLETLLSPEAYQHLSEAEEQIELDEATFQEMDEDLSPDLSPEEKALLAAYQENPQEFLPFQGDDTNGHHTAPEIENSSGEATLWVH